MRYFSTFTGIGGFELGIIKAYESNNEHALISEKSEQEERPQGRFWPTDKHGVQLHSGDGTTPLCVGYSEIDKYAVQIYQSHFPEHKNYGDITKINATELPDFDLFVGGFPCQAFSIAGKRGGFDDTRGTLFFDCARILKEKRPRNFILENVKGLLSHDNGNTFKTIIATLVELGYCVEWQVLNAKNFGVPQNRERVFIVGHLGGIPERKVFPIGKDGGEVIELQRHTANTLTARYEPAQATGTYIGESKRDAQKIVPYADGRKGRSSMHAHRVPEIGNEKQSIRRLTPLECERLMGYPDGWTEGVSDTQRYKTLGNGIVSNVVAEVVKRIIDK